VLFRLNNARHTLPPIEHIKSTSNSKLANPLDSDESRSGFLFFPFIYASTLSPRSLFFALFKA